MSKMRLLVPGRSSRLLIPSPLVLGIQTRFSEDRKIPVGYKCDWSALRSHRAGGRGNLGEFEREWKKDPDEFTFNSDNPAVRVPSARQLIYADGRANPKGRLPDNTWIHLSL
jgi:hypothetical protein